jgi:hypothetical protein
MTMAFSLPNEILTFLSASPFTVFSFSFQMLISQPAPVTPISRQASEIQWTLHLFEGPARHTVGVDHGRPHIRMPEQFLYRADVVICLKQVRSETVPFMPSSA